MKRKLRPGTVYTAAQVEAFKTKLFRQHALELQTAKREAFDAGFAAGGARAQLAMRVALGLDETRPGDTFQQRFVIVRNASE